MKWKNSFCNSTIIKNDLKRFWWISLIIALFMIFTKPIQIASECSRGYMNEYEIERLLSLNNGDNPFIFIILLAPILIGIMIFRYIHVKKACVLVHKMPIKRSIIYNSHIITGLILILVPIIINTLILIPTLISCDLYEMYNLSYIIKWTSLIIVIEISIFMFSVFVGMLTGTSWSHGILTCIFLCLPLGLGMLVLKNLEYLLYGFAYNYSLERKLVMISPLTRFMSWDSVRNFHFIHMITYLVASIIIYFISKHIYNIRKSEAAGNTIAFPILIPIFKYGVIISFMMLLVVCFKSMNKNPLFIFVGYMIFALIGYIVSEVFVNKSFRILKNIKTYLYFCIVIIIAAIGFKFDIIGYEKYVPKYSEVQEVNIGKYSMHRQVCEKEYAYKEEKNIKNILKLHKSVIEDENINKTHKYDTKPLVILYTLKSGKNVLREYEIPYGEYEDNYKDIYESKESKEINYKDILGLNSNNVDKITIVRDGKNLLGIANNREIEEIINIVKEEINNMKYEDIEGNRSWGNIRMYYNSEDITKKSEYSVRWRKSFSELEKYFKDKGYLNKVRIMPKDIEYAVIHKLNGKRKAWHLVNDIRNESKDESEKTLEINNKQEIDICLRNSESYFSDEYENEGYIIEYHLKDRENPIFEKLTGNLVPEFITENFKSN